MAHSIQNRLGQAVLGRRTLLTLTQEAAAAKAKISVRSWRDLEAGKTIVGLDVVEKVIGALDWSWSELVTALVPASTDEDATPPTVKRLLDEAWRRATPREREVVSAGLRVLAGGKRTKP